MASDRELVDQLDHVWTAMRELGTPLSEAEWKTPTEVPGWTVQDNLVHVTAFEWGGLGRPAPDHTIPDGLPYLKNDIGRSNEVFVDSRRGRSGADALNEFAAVTADRLAQLRSFTPDDFGAETWTPVGPGEVRDLLPFRIFDSWVHEQDMRRAVRHPGDLEGVVADEAFERIRGAMPFVIGKQVAPPDGTTVVFDLSGPPGASFAVLKDGRARLLDAVPGDATVRVATDGETFARLACGRLDPAAVLAGGAVRVEGDRDLGRVVIERLNFLF